MDESLSIFNYPLSRVKIALEFWQLNGESFVSQLLPTQTMLCCIPKQQLYFTTFFKQQCSIYCPVGFIDAEDGTGNVINGTWRDDNGSVSGLQPLGQVGGNRHSMNADSVRNAFKNYFVSSQGEVECQYG